MQTFLKLFKLVSVLLGPLVVVLLVGYLWDEGYLGFYWEHYESIYDQKLGVYRCLDENGNIEDSLKPPCVVMTSRGRNAMERRVRECRSRSQKPEDCNAEAYEWLLSKRPK